MSQLAALLERAGMLPSGGFPVQTPRIALELTASGVVMGDALAEFLRKRLALPLVPSHVLGLVPCDTLDHVPAELAHVHHVLPMTIDEAGNLTLAMSDPTDDRAVDAIASHTGATIVRAVAEVGALDAAIAKHYGSTVPRVASVTPLSTTTSMLANAHESPLSLQAVSRVLPHLLTAPNRDALTNTMLEFLAEGFEHVLMFVHLRGQLQGRDARGPDLLLDAVPKVRIPVASESMFADVLDGDAPFVGPWPRQRPIDRAFSDALGNIRDDVLLLPIRLRGKTPVLVFATGAQAAIDVAAMTQLSQGVAQALERLIYSRKTTAETESQ